MTKGKIHYHTWKAHRSPDTAPDWATRCERWYQLDLAAYTLTDAFHNLLNLEQLNDTELFLSCPFSSNRSDWNFVSNGATSPALFVHTLPNVRLSSALQISKSHHSFICLLAQQSPLSRALREMLFSLKHSNKQCLLIHCEEAMEDFCKIHLFAANQQEAPQKLIKSPKASRNWLFQKQVDEHLTDTALLGFFESSTTPSTIQLPNFFLSE